MGILALKAMAKGPWQEGADRTGYPKCWYEPLSDAEDITMGLRFHPVTPGDCGHTSGRGKTVQAGSQRLRQPEAPQSVGGYSIREKALKGVPLFSFKAS